MGAVVQRGSLIRDCIVYARELRRLKQDVNWTLYKELSDEELLAERTELANRINAHHGKPIKVPPTREKIRMEKELEQRAKTVYDYIGHLLGVRKTVLRQGGSTREINQQIRVERQVLEEVQRHLAELDRRSRRNVEDL